jgi:hypothetical protein
MRSTFLAIAVSLLAGVAAPALAATKQAPAPTWESCEALAVERAQVPSQMTATAMDGQFNSFMKTCLAGKIPF